MNSSLSCINNSAELASNFLSRKNEKDLDEDKNNNWE